MQRRLLSIVGLGVLLVGALAFAACGDDDDAPNATPTPVAEGDDESPGDSVTSGSILADTFLTYEGRQYQLREILQADLIEGGDADFSEIGDATHADIDGDLTVYTREGDSTNVYTFWTGSGEGEAATLDSWYRWEPVS